MEVGDLLVEKVLSSLDSATSPVTGERFPKLSPEYKKKKLAQGGSGSPDLFLEGDLYGSLTYENQGDGVIDLGFFDDQAAKADGHLKFSGRENNTPKRRFLPADGQKFKSEITQAVDDIIQRASDDLFDASDFDDVNSTKDLYGVLRDQFEGMSRSEIRTAVLMNPQLSQLLDQAGVSEFL